MSRVERMFGPRSEWGDGNERERVKAGRLKDVPVGGGGKLPKKESSHGRRDTPSVSKLTAPPRSAQGSLGRGDPAEKAERPEGGAREARKAGFNLGNHPGISGFVSIRCGGCNKVINTCLREKRTAFVCRGCGHETSLERVANIHMKCGRCGFIGKYRTNRTEEQITMGCLSCSAIVPMKRVRRGNYVPEVEV